MVLDNDVISDFIKATNDSAEDSSTTILYGTVQKIGSKTYVVIDGSSESVPVDSTVVVSNGDRVTVTIENHTATVTGNLTDKSASSGELADAQTIIDEQGNQITALNTSVELLDSVIEIDESVVTINGVDIDLLSTTVSTINSEISALNSSIEVINSEISAQNSTIETVQSNVSTINSEISALNGSIEVINSEISAQNSTIETIQSNVSTINSEISALNSSISVLESSIEIYNSSFQITDGVVTGIKGVDTEWVTTDSLEASVAAIESLDTDYAQIDFANIGEAAVEKLFSDSGIIGNLVMEDGYVTGTLVGVTIKGDLIEAGTIVADRLVIVGTDGLYYALNTDGTTVTSEQTEYNSLNGGVITAQSVTADKISVSDLVAFDATIGGFNITEDSIYSGVKASVDNTTRGIYLDDDGQICFGDASNFLKYYYDSGEGTWKLAISANSLTFTASDGTSSDISDTIDALNKSTIVGYSFQYAISDSYSDMPTDGWSETADWTEGSYIWQRSVAVYGSGNIEYGEPVCITGNTGADGATISGYAIAYQASASSTNIPTGTWYSAVQATSTSKPYLWTRTVVEYSDGTSTASYSVSSTMDSVDIETPVNELWAQFTDSSGNAWINMTSTPSIQIGKSDSYDLVEVTQNDITVGDKSSKHVYIDSDSIDLVDSTETLGTFTSDYVRIGSQAGTSAELSNSLLTIYDTSDNAAFTAGIGTGIYDGKTVITSGGNGNDFIISEPITSSYYNQLYLGSPYSELETSTVKKFTSIMSYNTSSGSYAASGATYLTSSSQVIGVYFDSYSSGTYMLYSGRYTLSVSSGSVTVTFVDDYDASDDEDSDLYALFAGTADVRVMYEYTTYISTTAKSYFSLESGDADDPGVMIRGGSAPSVSSDGSLTFDGTEWLDLTCKGDIAIASETGIALSSGNATLSFADEDTTFDFNSNGSQCVFKTTTTETGADSGLHVYNNATNTSVKFIIGSGGTNRGIYDSTYGNWIIYRNKSLNTYLLSPKAMDLTSSSTMSLTSSSTMNLTSSSTMSLKSSSTMYLKSSSALYLTTGDSNTLYIRGRKVLVRPTGSTYTTSSTGQFFQVQRFASDTWYDGTSEGGVVICCGIDSTSAYFRSYAVYHRTTTTSANVHVTSSGTFARVSSSASRYKNSINYLTNADNASDEGKAKQDDTVGDVEDDMLSLLDLPVVKFHYNEGYINGESNYDYDQWVTGFIAEDVEKICPECATYIGGDDVDDDREPQIEAWDVMKMVPRMLYIIQHQESRITELENRIEALEGGEG